MHSNAKFSLPWQQQLVSDKELFYATKLATIKQTSTSIKNSSMGLQYNILVTQFTFKQPSQPHGSIGTLYRINDRHSDVVQNTEGMKTSDKLILAATVINELNVGKRKEAFSTVL